VEVINPDNMMPAPNQEPADGQAASLSTERVASTIPRAGDGLETWTYPSEQMFYNALLRKGKGDGVQEQTMSAVVAIHNNMNERAWKQVLEWEAMHCDECAAPKLVRFVGRPEELSPKARFKVALGLRARPFDRHDWTVDRCGKEVRYILDYYDLEHKQREDRLPELHDINSVPSIEMDVRPALDSPSALLDRLKMLITPAGNPASGEVGSFAKTPIDPPKAPPSAASSTEIFGRCRDAMAAVSQCEGERECSQAQISLTMCIAAQVCSAEHAAFRALKGSTDAEAVAAQFDVVQDCVGNWSELNRGQ